MSTVKLGNWEKSAGFSAARGLAFAEMVHRLRPFPANAKPQAAKITLTRSQVQLDHAAFIAQIRAEGHRPAKFARLIYFAPQRQYVDSGRIFRLIRHDALAQAINARDPKRLGPADDNPEFPRLLRL